MEIGGLKVKKGCETRIVNKLIAIMNKHYGDKNGEQNG